MEYYSYKAMRYWPTWIGLACLWLIGNLPYQIQLSLGWCSGQLVYCLPNKRKQVARINLKLCFPELSDGACEKLLRESLIENAIGMVLTTRVWFGNVDKLQKLAQLSGIENIAKALKQKKGIVLVGLHFATMELAGSLFANIEGFNYSVLYRKFKNELFDEVIKHRRARFYGQVIERSQTLRVYRLLKSGGILWYAPDHDYGLDQSVFAPFFNISTATITATMRLTNINDSAVIMSTYYRGEKGRYFMNASAPVKNFPSGDDVVDAGRINQLIEAAVRKYPAQYIWTHRRFKTRPAGEISPYKELNIRNKIGRRINKKRFDFLTSSEHNQRLTGTDEKPSILQAQSGEIYKIFWPTSRWPKFYWAAAWKFYRHSKILAQRGIKCPQPTAISRYPEQRVYIAVYPKLEGETLRQRLSASNNDEVLTVLATFMAELHSQGIFLKAIDLSHILINQQNELSVVSIAETNFSSRPLKKAARLENLAHLLNQQADSLIFTVEARAKFVEYYQLASDFNVSPELLQ